jgi:NtrC-family two-component system response regulator AlgB
LRERPGDILALADKLLTEAAARNRRPGLRLSEETQRSLAGYAWPGNVRELRNAIERAVALSRGTLIRKEDLPDSIFHSHATGAETLPKDASLEQIEEQHIRRILSIAPTLEDAAATLGIGIATLWRKRKRYHID